MKKLILTFGIFLAGIFCVDAQGKGASKMLDHLTQVCQLTPDQINKVKPVIENYESAKKANKQQFASDPASLKGADKTAKEHYKAELKAILTPDQQAKLKADMEQRKANKKGGQEKEQE